MNPHQCLTQGGLPDAWTVANLQWLAAAHQHHAAAQIATRTTRAAWHIRWAALVTDILESHIAYHR